MVDEALRALVRAAQVGGVADRLACAHALERAGRRDEALDVLVPARGDPALCRELERFPCWSQEGATAGQTRDVDSAALVDPPEVLWRSARLPLRGRSPGGSAPGG